MRKKSTFWYQRDFCERKKDLTIIGEKKKREKGNGQLFFLLLPEEDDFV